jgi:hypothetical protein
LKLAVQSEPTTNNTPSWKCDLEFIFWASVEGEVEQCTLIKVKMVEMMMMMMMMMMSSLLVVSCSFGLMLRNDGVKDVGANKKGIRG